MKFELITLDGVKFSEEAYSVVLPTATGQITIMPDHEALLSVLVPGVITIRVKAADADVEHFATYGGIVEVTPAGTKVLVDEADNDNEINAAEAEKAHAAAQKLLSEAKTHVELEHAQAMVDRQAVRLQVSSLKRHHQRR